MSDDEPDANVVLNDDDFDELDIEAVAERLNCSIGDVITHVNEGRLPAYQMGDKVWFHSSEVAKVKKA